MAAMARIISPYERRGDARENRLSLAVGLSIGFHAVAAWLFLFVFPHLVLPPPAKMDEYITIQFQDGGSTPSVAPVTRTPPVREEATRVKPSRDPAREVTVPPPPRDVILIGPTGSEGVSTIARTPSTAPPVTPPPVAEDKPKPEPAADIDAAIGQKLKTMEDQVAARELDQAIEAQVAGIATKLGPGAAGGLAGEQSTDPLKAAYYSRVRDIIISNWVLPPGAAMNLRARYVIVIEPDGRISGFRLENASGDEFFDLSAERAIGKSNPLPPLPSVFGGQADTVGLDFNPRDAHPLGG